MIKLKKKYTTNIDEELLKEAKIKAIQENVNLNDLIERLLRDYLNMRWLYVFRLFSMDYINTIYSIIIYPNI